jgi:hypothetical protein
MTLRSVPAVFISLLYSVSNADISAGVGPHSAGFSFFLKTASEEGRVNDLGILITLLIFR